eukprot:354731-Chlamydomonas_euryale.AAC.7
MAMGNFPYPSGYIINGMGTLPAFPVRAACERLRWDNMTENELMRGCVRRLPLWRHTPSCSLHVSLGGLRGLSSLMDGPCAKPPALLRALARNRQPD